MGLQFWWELVWGIAWDAGSQLISAETPSTQSSNPIRQPNGFSCSGAVLNRVSEFKPSVLFGLVLVSRKEVQSVSRAICGDDIPKCPHHVAGDFLSALPSAR
jgi:hypothetical protein